MQSDLQDARKAAADKITVALSHLQSARNILLKVEIDDGQLKEVMQDAQHIRDRLREDMS